MLHGRFQGRAEGVEPAAARHLMAQVDQRHLRHRPIEHAPRQAQQRVLAALGVVPAFQRRRGGAEDDRNVFQPGPHHGDVAGMIARRRFLLEAAFVLLVDDDQAQLAGRRENGAAGPDDDLHLAGRDAPPMATALGVAQVAVQHSHARRSGRGSTGSSAASG